MTKQDLAKQVSILSNGRFNEPDAKKMIELVIIATRVALNSNKTIFLRGFGTIGMIRRAPKLARNISQGTTMLVPEKYVPRVKFSENFLK